MSRLNARYPRFPAMRANFDMKIGKIDHGPHTVTLEESVFFSYGFRPFFAIAVAGLFLPLIPKALAQRELLSVLLQVMPKIF